MDIGTARVIVAALDHLDECPAGEPLLYKALQQLEVDKRAEARMYLTAYTAGYEQAQTDAEAREVMPKGRWVPCSPRWVTEYQACDATVRRPILAVRPVSDNTFTQPPYDAVGHEHMMLVENGRMTPLAHETGESA